MEKILLDKIALTFLANPHKVKVEHSKTNNDVGMYVLVYEKLDYDPENPPSDSTTFKFVAYEFGVEFTNLVVRVFCQKMKLGTAGWVLGEMQFSENLMEVSEKEKMRDVLAKVEEEQRREKIRKEEEFINKFLSGELTTEDPITKLYEAQTKKAKELEEKMKDTVNTTSPFYLKALREEDYGY